MKLARLFRLTATVVLVQIALGGLVTFGFVAPLVHIVWGTLVVAVAIFTAVTALRTKPPDGGLRGVMVGLLAQVALGFMTLSLGSSVLAWIHLMVGVLIYAMALTGMSFAQRAEYMSASQRGA